MNTEALSSIKTFSVEEYLSSPLMVATSCSWRRILFSSGKGACVPTNTGKMNIPTLDASEKTLNLFAASPFLLAATLLLLDRLKASLSNNLAIDDRAEIITFSQEALLMAIDNKHAAPALAEKELIHQSRIINVNMLDPLIVQHGDNSTIGTHIASESGQRICAPANAKHDNHPDLNASLYMLQLFSASPELFEATRWLLSRLERTISQLPIGDAPDVISFSESALKKVAQEA